MQQHTDYNEPRDIASVNSMRKREEKVKKRFANSPWPTFSNACFKH